MRIHGFDIGVCSWSLRPKDTAELLQSIQQLGLSHLQLEMGGMEDAELRHRVEQVRAAGITITAGMIGFAGEDYSTIAIIRQTGGFLPDAVWPERKKTTEHLAQLGQELGFKRVSMHVGFVPASSDARYKVMVERVGGLADVFGQCGLELLMETGQESSSELLQFLNDLARKNVCVNFDPANLLLYGAGDSVEAIHTLGRHIGHVHIKDATMSSRPAVNWGTEVPFGTGQVPHAAFLRALKEVGYTGPLVIEREAGEQRMKDVSAAIETLKSLAG